MSGLGIVVEEAHYDDILPPLPDSANQLTLSIDDDGHNSHNTAQDTNSDYYDGDDSNDLRTVRHSSNSSQSQSGHTATSKSASTHAYSTQSHSPTSEAQLVAEFDDFHLMSSTNLPASLADEFVNYELDSPNLINQSFFDVSPLQSNNSDKPTSGLSRLKSLKKGIRKLSLSSNSNSNSALTINSSSLTSLAEKMTSSSPEKRPGLTPLQASSLESGKYSFNSTATSSLSDKRSLQLDDVKLVKTASSSTGSTANMGSSKHSPTSSIASINTVNTSTTNPALKRNRAVSVSQSIISPLTPPLNSSIITLSENLNLPKKSILNIEQSYFDSLKDHSKVSSIAELDTSGDLIEYSQYLTNQKSTLAEAFEMAKFKLSDSGWCSPHDLNNLQLQQDSSICQIDTKLLQIEEKLNREYNISLLGGVSKGIPKDSEPVKRGPSLQEIEGKYYQFN